jgi:hypothetical protein
LRIAALNLVFEESSGPLMHGVGAKPGTGTVQSIPASVSIRKGVDTQARLIGGKSIEKRCDFRTPLSSFFDSLPFGLADATSELPTSQNGSWAT